MFCYFLHYFVISIPCEPTEFNALEEKINLFSKNCTFSSKVNLFLPKCWDFPSKILNFFLFFSFLFHFCQSDIRILSTCHKVECKKLAHLKTVNNVCDFSKIKSDLKIKAKKIIWMSIRKFMSKLSIRIFELIHKYVFKPYIVILPRRLLFILTYLYYKEWNIKSTLMTFGSHRIQNKRIINLAQEKKFKSMNTHKIWGWDMYKYQLQLPHRW